MVKEMEIIKKIGHGFAKKQIESKTIVEGLYWLESYIKEYNLDIEVTQMNIDKLNEKKEEIINKNPDEEIVNEIDNSIKQEIKRIKGYRRNRDMMYKMKYLAIQKLATHNVLHAQRTDIREMGYDKEYLLTEYKTLNGLPIYQLKMPYDKEFLKSSLYVEETIKIDEYSNRPRPFLKEIQKDFRQYMNMNTETFMKLKLERYSLLEEGFNYIAFPIIDPVSEN